MLIHPGVKDSMWKANTEFDIKNDYKRNFSQGDIFYLVKKVYYAPNFTNDKMIKKTFLNIYGFSNIVDLLKLINLLCLKF